MSDGTRAAAARGDPLGDAIAMLTRLLANEREAGGLSTGDRAELRRMDPEDVLPPALWRLLTLPEIEQAIQNSGSENGRERVERAWAVLVGTMLEAGTLGPRAVGKVLAGAREEGPAYAEQRFVRLLRARGLPEVAHEARQAAGWCAAQGARPRFTDGRGLDGFGPFILAAALDWDREAERRAHAIARDYFATLQRETRATET